MIKKKEFQFADKVHDFIDSKNYVILNMTLGFRYVCANEKGGMYHIYQDRLKRGWIKSQKSTKKS